MVKHTAFIKVVPVKERARAIFDKLFCEGACYHAADYTSFESHFVDDKMRLSHDFYRYMTSQIFEKNSVKSLFTFELLCGSLDMSLLQKFLDEIIANYRICEMRNFGSLEIFMRRMSGEMDTSLSNTYTNFVMVQYMAYDSLGYFEEVPTFVEGDDSITRYPSGVDPTEDDYAALGWIIKMDVHEDLCTASFCGLVFDEVDLITVTSPMDVLAKFGWSNRRYVRSSHKCLMSLLRSKALSLACEFGNVPILGPFAHRLLFLTRHVNIRKSVIDCMDNYKRNQLLQHMTEKPWQCPPKIPLRTRMLVERLYDIPISTQLNLENQLSNIMLGPFEVPSSLMSDSYIHNMTLTSSHLNAPRDLSPFREQIKSFVIDKLKKEGFLDDVGLSHIARL